MLTMFLTFVKVGLFSFGGGYAILAMLQQEIVVKHGWLTASEFTDVVAISQMTPGPIAINAATFIGFHSMASGVGALHLRRDFGASVPDVDPHAHLHQTAAKRVV